MCCCSDAGDLGVACRKFEILEAVRFVNDELIDAEFFKRDSVIIVLFAFFLATQAKCLMLFLERFNGTDRKIFFLTARGMQAISGFSSFFKTMDDTAMHGILPFAAEFDPRKL